MIYIYPSRWSVEGVYSHFPPNKTHRIVHDQKMITEIKILGILKSSLLNYYEKWSSFLPLDSDFFVSFADINYPKSDHKKLFAILNAYIHSREEHRFRFM